MKCFRLLHHRNLVYTQEDLVSEAFSEEEADRIVHLFLLAVRSEVSAAEARDLEEVQ